MNAPSPMSSIRFAVMLALAKGPSIGYGVFQRVQDDNGLYGIYINPDTIYKTLASLGKRGLIDSQTEPRTHLKTYTLTKHAHILIKRELFRLENTVRIGRVRIS